MVSQPPPVTCHSAVAWGLLSLSLLFSLCIRDLRCKDDDDDDQGGELFRCVIDASSRFLFSVFGCLGLVLVLTRDRHVWWSEYFFLFCGGMWLGPRGCERVLEINRQIFFYFVKIYKNSGYIQFYHIISWRRQIIFFFITVVDFHNLTYSKNSSL